MTWPERVATISIHAHMATRDDVARMAAELMVANSVIRNAHALMADDLPDLAAEVLRDAVEQPEEAEG
jgi:hypothetical protein